MTRKVRQLVTSAAVVAGFGFAAVIARAADYQNNPPISGAGVALVSVSDEEPASNGESAVRLSDPRLGSPPAEPNASRSATYPPKRPAAARPPAKPAQAASASATSPSATQSVAAKGQPAPAGPRRTAQPAVASKSLPASAVHRDSHLTAHFAVSEEKPESVKPPETALPPPSPDSSHCEGCGEYDGCGCDCPVWCAGMEFMYLRPHFGNATAFREMSQLEPIPGVGDNPGVAVSEDRAVNFDFDRDGDFHFFVGRHLGNGELRFGYTHIQGEEGAGATATGGFPNPGSTELISIWSGATLNDAGDTIATALLYHLNAFDIDRVQNLEFGGCNSCNSGWDITWSYGVRIVDVHETIDEGEINVGADPATTDFFRMNSRFIGAGPRIGIEARRNLWGSQFFGFFGANAGLLIGRYRSSVDHLHTSTTGLQDTLAIQESSLTRAVPNVDLELGVSWQPSCHTMITTGWRVESFTDAVASTANTGACMNCTPNLTVGSGNSLSFDGLFIRLEHCF